MRKLAAAILLGVLCSGCAVGEAHLTPTPNPTLRSISRMLTATRAAPTATIVPTITPTRAVTPSPTVEIPVSGSQKLPLEGGKRVELGGVAITLLAANRVQELERLTAEEDSAYFDMEVLLENLSGQPVEYTPLDFRLLSSTNELLQPAVDSLQPALLSGDLPAGEWVRGHLAFPIIESETPTLLRYRPTQNGAERGETWFDLASLGSVSSEPQAMRAWPADEIPRADMRQEESGVGLTIEQVEISPRMPARKAKNGMRFVLLSVRIENINHTRMPYNPLYFRVKDRYGFEYLPMVGAPETSLQAGSLGRGQSVRNVVIFEVPETAQKLVVTYQPTVLMEEYLPIRVVIVLPEETSASLTPFPSRSGGI